MRSFALETLEFRQFLSASPLAAVDDGSSADVQPIFVVSDPGPSSHGLHLTEYKNQKFTAKLGTFHLKVIDLALSAKVDWGDGTHSAGVIEGSYATGDWYVEGTHKYAHTGTYDVKVQILTKLIGSPNGPSGEALHFDSQIKVKTLKPTEGGRELTETVGKKFNTKLGEVNLKTIDLVFNAVINWGDGTHSDGKLVGSYATGDYYVYGKHTYAHTGTYKVDVKVFGHPAGSNIHPTDPFAKFTSVIHVKSA